MLLHLGTRALHGFVQRANKFGKRTCGTQTVLEAANGPRAQLEWWRTRLARSRCPGDEVVAAGQHTVGHTALLLSEQLAELAVAGASGLGHSDLNPKLWLSRHPRLHAVCSCAMHAARTPQSCRARGIFPGS